MDIAILARRNAEATERLVSAAQAIAEGLGLHEQVEALISARSKDVDVDALIKREATADLLEAVAKAIANTGSASGESAPQPDDEGPADTEAASAGPVRKARKGKAK